MADSREFLGNRVSEQLVWVSIKAVYAKLIADRDDWALAETFFNSVARAKYLLRLGLMPRQSLLTQISKFPQPQPECQCRPLIVEWRWISDPIWINNYSVVDLDINVLARPKIARCSQ